jgi:hypothetical protein
MSDIGEMHHGIATAKTFVRRAAAAQAPDFMSARFQRGHKSAADKAGGPGD